MKKQLIKLTVFLMVLSCIGSVANAQETQPEMSTPAVKTWPRNLTFGLGAGINLNFASGDYQIPGDSNTFSSGFGVGPTFHLLFEIPFAENWMVSPRIAFNERSASFTDGKSTAIDPANRDTNFAFSLQHIGLDVNFKYSFNNFHVLFGPSFSSAIKKTYAFGNSAAASGSSSDLPNASSFFISVGAGVGYDIPINKTNTVWLSPEVFYHLGLTNLGGDNSTLKVSNLRAALSVKFDLGDKKQEVMMASAEKPEMSIMAKGILPNGDLTTDPIIPEQATRTRSSMPLLPYVFFDYNSEKIPARYNTSSAATGFSIESLQGRTEEEVNHQGLNVLGARMKQKPSAKIKLTGTNSNSGDERNNIQLSKKRALAIRDYLVNSWGIDGSRIIVDQRNLPELPTNPVTKAGMEENRRVEISSDDASITEPVKIENRKSEAIGETLVRFETNIRNADKVSINSWKITMDMNGSLINSVTQSGNGNPPRTVPVTIPEAMSYANQPIHYQMEVVDSSGKTHVADGMTRIVRKTVDRDNLEKYAMLSFDFDKSEINDRAQKMISLIGESINREANAVAVRGFCDNTGADDYNQALSEARAAEAAKALRAATRLPANVQVVGNGKRSPKFNNELPEGRMLNRRVEVEIQKSSR